MLEELLNNQENSKSILVIDDIQNNASLFLYSLINKFIQRGSNLLQLYPTHFQTQDRFEKFFGSQATVHDVLSKYLFQSQNNLQCCFKSIMNDLDKLKELAIQHDQKKSSFLIFDNINLVLRHFHNNPFKLMHFILDSSKRIDVSSVIMVIHKDTVDETLLNQIKSTFQTIINVTQLQSTFLESKTDELSKRETSKYDLSIRHRNLKSAQVKLYDESIYLNEKFIIEKIEKHLKTLKTKTKESEKTEEDVSFKDLTFNVHLNDDDLEAKRNLILPYELIGQSNPLTKTNSQQKMAEAIKEESSKIYYAPDEVDDVDDDDPDDDLNF